jgi:O-antigen/teichoic acid export membrane protein/4-amino-4-deoxy-L-arabinose transferase-like glycosyltransferase
VSTREETAAKGGLMLVSRFAVIALLNYALGVVLAWLLTKDEYGRVSAVQAVLLLAAYTLNSGFPWILAWTEARRTSLEPGRAAAVFRSSLLGNSCFGLALGLGLVLLQVSGVRILPPGSTLMVVTVAASFPVFGVNAVFKGALHGRRRFSAFGLVQAAEVLVKCVVAVLLVETLHLGATAVAIAFLVGAAAATIMGAWRLRDDLPIGRGPLAGPGTYRDAVPMFVGSAGFALFATADVLGLQAIGHAFGLTAATVAVYQVAVLLGRAPYFIADALADAVFPFIAREHDSAQASHRWFATAGRWILLVVVPIELFMVVRPQPLLQLFFPARYASALPLIRLVAFGTLGMIGCGVYGKSLQALGRRDAVAKTMPAVLFVELTVLGVLVPRWGAMGAAVAFSLSAWTGAVLVAITYHRHQRIGLPGRAPAARYLIALLFPLGGLALAPAMSPVRTVALMVVTAVAYLGLARSFDLLTDDDVERVRGLMGGLRRRVRATGADASTAEPATPRRARVWPALRTGTEWLSSRMLARPLYFALALFAFSIVSFTANIVASPDTQYDEVVYTRAAQQVASTGQLTWSTEPVFVHPPLYFLTQAGWLAAVGLDRAPLFDAIHAARLLSATIGAVNAVLLGMLTLAVTSAARPRRRVLLVIAVVAIAATDPVLVRYSRLAIIDPLALLGCLVTLLVSWRARNWTWRRHLFVVGLLTGLTLLTKEISIFLLIVPVLFGVTGRDWRYVRRAAGAIAVGFAFWLAFPLWAVLLGTNGRFWEVKLFTVERLLGLLQVTGWNRPGVSFTAALLRSAPQYLTSYLLLAAGALALLWLFFRRNTESARYVLVVLLCSYAFAAFTIVQGTLNEQFFMYVLPAAIVGAVLGLDCLISALLSRAEGSRVLGAAAPLASGVVIGLAALSLAVAGGSWRYQYGEGSNNGIERMAGFVESNYPHCAAFNASGDAQKYAYSLQGRTVTSFGSGPGALAHGIHYFFLNPKDALVGYGRMSPDLATWIRSHGRPLVVFPSRTYQGVQLWEVPSDQYEPSADVERINGGLFVNTVGSRCGGYAVRNDANGLFYREYEAMGGKGVVGAPISGSWREGDRTVQAFNSAVLEAGQASAGHAPQVRARPAVAALAKDSPEIYARYQLPPIRYHDTAPPAAKVVLARLDDVRIARAYLGVAPAAATSSDVARALDHVGAPLGPATRMPDGAVRQAFTKVVFERPPTAPDVVRLAPVGRAVAEATHLVPPSASVPQRPPPFPLPAPPRLRTDVMPFVWSLAALALCYLALFGVPLGIGRLRRARTRQPVDAPAPIDESEGSAS